MKKGLIVLVAMFLPMSLFGSTELIYAWGYGSSLNEALQALKGLTSEADYIIKSALAIAVLVFSISKALDSKSSPVWEIGKLVLLYGIVYHFFLSPSNNTYVIHDEVSGNDYKVSKLPSGLGNTVSLMSRLEKVILDGMEKHYSTPNSIAYSKAGLGFSLGAMMDIPTLRITRKDALMQSNMNYYVKSCYSNNLGIRIHQNSVLNSSDLAQTILLEKDGKLVYWQQDDGNGGIKSSIISCGEAATMIKKGFLNVADLIQNETAIKNVIVADYLDKFQNVAQLYFGQAAGSREQFQQILVMNALDDGIINTAKMLGLNPQSFAANTAIADQTITTSMQSQGRLAQTYLPLAKAYMTIIVISVSWLMAIISIMFGSYTHIKMFFTLCLTMVLWTPILSIINFLNDLNIQHTFGVINQNDAAFTYSNYKEVIQKVTANSNFLNYLVMLTPMLAYALAKGSEMGFVSIASSLSQQLAGASRAASSFATQQALSTSTAITSPKGDEVYAREAGATSHKSAFYDGSGNLTSSNTQTDGYGGTANSAISNAVMSGTNVGGSMQGAKLSNAAIESLNSYGQTNATNWKKDFSLAYSHIKEDGQVAALNTARGFVDNKNEQFAKEWAKNLQEEISSGSELTKSAAAKVTAYTEASAGFTFLGSGLKAGIRGDITAEQAAKMNLTEQERVAYNEALRRSATKSLCESDSIESSWSQTLSDKTGYAFQEMRNKDIAYTEAQNSVQSVKSDDLNNLMNGVARGMAANDGASWNSLSTAQQDRYFANTGSMISDMAQNNPAALQALQKEYGAGGTTSGEKFGVSDFKGANVLLQANLNHDQVTRRSVNARNSTDLPDGIDLKGKQSIDAKKVSQNYTAKSIFDKSAQNFKIN